MSCLIFCYIYDKTKYLLFISKKRVYTLDNMIKGEMQFKVYTPLIRVNAHENCCIKSCTYTCLHNMPM